MVCIPSARNNIQSLLCSRMVSDDVVKRRKQYPIWRSSRAGRRQNSVFPPRRACRAADGKLWATARHGAPSYGYTGHTLAARSSACAHFRSQTTLILNIYIRGKIIHKVFYFLKPYSINKVWEELTKPLNYDPRYIHLQLGWSLPRLFSPQTSLSLSDKRTRSTAAQHRMDLRTSRDLKPGIARPILSDSLRPGLSLATSMVAGGNPILPWLGGYRREMICRELGARGYLRNQHAQ